jgi:hypothetical protein
MSLPAGSSLRNLSGPSLAPSANPWQSAISLIGTGKGEIENQMREEVVVNWRFRGHDLGFYTEIDFIRCWLAVERLLAGDAEYESWITSYTQLL